MATTLPMKTTETDLEKVSAYLKNQVGWVELDKIRKAIPAKHANALKIEAMRHLGLIERDGQNIKLTEDGREYASGDDAVRTNVVRRRLRADPLYNATLEWLHFNDKTSPSKTDVANYWHDNHAGETGNATGDALTDPTVFFMRMVGAAGLGKFVAAGTGRDTHLKMDVDQLASFATGEPPPADPAATDPPPTPPVTPQPPVTPAQPPVTPTLATVGTGLNVNVEIHIAADAKPATIEEIFKNMRKYLIDGPDQDAAGD